MAERVFVIGVGMTDFVKPSARPDWDYPDMVREAGGQNVDVIELHDCFSTNELITYEGLGLCPPGKGGELIDSGATTYGGRWAAPRS